ncbi:MAG: DUF4373 domain-containing protein [Prevotella sp.]|nr:DUF4373 domain-containing protein [Prevotella sp.]
MARPIKNGMDYFPMDVDMFDDDKLIGVSMKFGVTGEMVAVKLLCAIYRDGYYAVWQKRLRWKLMQSMRGTTEEVIDEIVLTLVEDGFFDEHLFRAHSVLTSRGIQKRYFTSKRKKETDLPYVLLSGDCKNVVSATKTPVDTSETGIDTTDIPQRKEKENKEKENEKETLSLPCDAPQKEKSGGESDMDFEIFRKYFNGMLTNYHSRISLLRVMTDDRKDALRALLKKGYTKGDMAKVMRAAAASPQLNGRTKKSFIPGFDWLMREENFVRVLEGEFNAKWV